MFRLRSSHNFFGGHTAQRLLARSTGLPVPRLSADGRAVLVYAYNHGRLRVRTVRRFSVEHDGNPNVWDRLR